MFTRTLLVLAEFSLELGFIDISEYEERIQVARWLSDNGNLSADPRTPQIDKYSEPLEGPDSKTDGETVRIVVSGKVADAEWIELVVLGNWYFTRSDPDPYPAIPHGHLQSADRSWPKLNPYTGRVFKAKHQEELSLRLSKQKMRELWKAEAFRNYCRSHILWYAEAHPRYGFSVRHPLRFPRW